MSQGKAAQFTVARKKIWGTMPERKGPGAIYSTQGHTLMTHSDMTGSVCHSALGKGQSQSNRASTLTITLVKEAERCNEKSQHVPQFCLG